MKEKLYRASDIIRAIDKHTKDTPHGLVLDEDITIILEEMKSVEPDASVCWGCNCPKMERKTFSEMVHLHDAETHSCDCISRQAAIDALERIFDRCEEIEAHLPEDDPDRTGYKMYPDYMTVWKYLHQLPAAQPELDEWCTDCKEYDSERHCCPRYNRVIREAVEEAKSDDDWIPCSKRLPEESGTYLVTHHYDYVPVGCIQTDVLDFEDGAWYWWNEKGELEKWDDPIIAWKPMPEPWKGRRRRRMTDREKAIVMAHTGIVMLTGDRINEFYKYLSELYGRPVYTHEVVALDIKEKSMPDFIRLCREEQPERKTGHWIYTGSGQECSVCGEIQYGYDNGRNFCPNCGSYNKGDKHENQKG